MLKIHLLTGTYMTETIEVEGTKQDDLMAILDDYYYENGELPVAMYEMDELDEYELESYIPINGGEWYIEGISHIDEVEEEVEVEEMYYESY